MASVETAQEVETIQFGPEAEPVLLPERCGEGSWSSAQVLVAIAVKYGGANLRLIDNMWMDNQKHA